MWVKLVLGFLSKGLAVVDKLLPSWEWKGGQAAAEAKAAKEAISVLQKQLAIASKPNLDRAELLERMRERKRED